MNFKLVLWNGRGLNERDKRRLVESLVIELNTDFLCLQETKLEGDIKEMINQIWGCRWVRYACLEANGSGGGGGFYCCGTVACGKGRFYKLELILFLANLKLFFWNTLVI